VAEATELIFRTGTKSDQTQRSVCEAVIMEAVRESWTDERLDDLNDRVSELGGRMDSRFDRVDARFDSMDAKFDAKFDAIDGKFDAKFDAMDAKFDAMQRLMIQVGGGIIATLLASFAGLIATQL
jgi:hypothetical protein